MTAQRNGPRLVGAMVFVLGQISLMGLLNPAIAVADTSVPCFKVLDSTLFLNRPDLSEYGMERVAVFGVSNWLPKTAALYAVPEEATIRDWIAQRKLPQRFFVLDLEHWPQHGPLDEVRKSVAGYLTILERVRRSEYSGVIGYYGLPPIRRYWEAIEPPQSPKYRAWQAENDLWQPLADAVDVLFPSLYTFYDDRNGWVRYAQANLSEARRLAKGKPIYAFVWPQYHESNKKLGGQFIPGEFWGLQLRTISEHADGVVIWGGWQSPWDDDAPWWKATQQFLKARPPACFKPSPPKGLAVEPTETSS